MDDVKIDLRAEQYEQALSLKDSIAALANWQTFFPFRPKTTPLQDPKAWWRYVCRRHGSGAGLMLQRNMAMWLRFEWVSEYVRVAEGSAPFCRDGG